MSWTEPPKGRRRTTGRRTQTEETGLTRCRQAPRSMQEEARAPAERLRLLRMHQRLRGQVGELGKGSRRRTWGQRVGVRQKQRRREGLTASLGCKATVAVEGEKKTLNPLISGGDKEEDRRDSTLRGGGEREADGGDGWVASESARTSRWPGWGVGCG